MKRQTPPKETKSTFSPEIEEVLKAKYFLIPRNAWWAFLGGVAAFSVAVGVVSHQSALKAVSDPAVQAAIQTIKDSAEKSKTSLDIIKRNVESSEDYEQRIAELETFVMAETAKRAETQKQAEALRNALKTLSLLFNPQEGVK